MCARHQMPNRAGMGFHPYFGSLEPILKKSLRVFLNASCIFDLRLLQVAAAKAAASAAPPPPPPIKVCSSIFFLMNDARSGSLFEHQTSNPKISLLFFLSIFQTPWCCFAVIPTRSIHVVTGNIHLTLNSCPHSANLWFLALCCAVDLGLRPDYRRCHCCGRTGKSSQDSFDCVSLISTNP